MGNILFFLYDRYDEINNNSNNISNYNTEITVNDMLESSDLSSLSFESDTDEDTAQGPKSHYNIKNKFSKKVQNQKKNIKYSDINEKYFNIHAC